MEENTMLNEAVRMAIDDIPVFPCSPADKRPLTARGFHDATADLAVISRWWEKWPTAMIGVPTGAASGFFAVDTDRKPAKGIDGVAALKELAAEYGGLPDTALARTPTGGEHVLFRMPPASHIPNSAGKLGRGIDIRGDGGYVIAAPSINAEGKAYSWQVPLSQLGDCPPWLLEKIGTASTPTHRNEEAPAVPLDQERAIGRAVDYLRNHAPPGIAGSLSEQAYKTACQVKDRGVSEGKCVELMLDHWPCSPPLEHADLANRVRNAYAYGRDRPGISDPAAEFSVVETAEPPSTAVQEPKAARKFKVRMFADIEPDLDKQWTVDDVLPANGVAVLYAKPNQGKSFTALDMGMAIARGIPWHGRETTKGAVLYVATEGAQAARVKAYRQHYRLERQSIPFAVIEDGANLCDGGSGDTAAIAQAGNELAAAAGEPLALIVIDTLAMALSGGDENSGQDMGAMLSNVRNIQRATGATVLIVHHEGKDTSRGMRGSSALGAAVDATLRIDDGVIEIEKQRDGEVGARFAFKLERIELGTNARGKVVSSCVAVPVNGSAQRDFAPPPLKAGTANAVALAVLESLIEAEGIAPPALDASAGVFDPPAKVISLDRWRMALSTGEFAKARGGKPKALKTLKKAVERAKAELIPRYVAESAGCVWIRRLAA